MRLSLLLPAMNFVISLLLKKESKVILCMKVSDSGGAESQIDTILDSQNNIDNKRKFGGLGLGLFIVKDIVDMQEGIIKMESVVGKVQIITLDFDIIESGELKYCLLNLYL
jgi:signal transduction histidine kinase